MASINLTDALASITDSLNGNSQRDQFVQELIALKPSTQAQLYAVLCKAWEAQGFTLATVGTEWDDLTQSQRDMLTVFSQARKVLFP